MHLSCLYYLTVGVTTFVCFGVDLFIRSVYFNILTTPSDFLREAVNNKVPVKDIVRRFDEIYAKIKTYYVREDVEKEKANEKKREQLARLVA
jgi:hypothetical protein